MENYRRQFLKKIAGITGVVTLSSVSVFAMASSRKSEVHDIRLSRHDGFVRLVFDLTGPVQHSIFTLHTPERIVLDLKYTQMPHGLVDQVNSNRLIRNIRSGVRNGHDLRVVFDLNDATTPRSFLLGPSGGSGHRLVIDLHDESNANVSSTKTSKKKKLRDVVIAIDAGHGGRDPGAIGRSGTREKTVTLQLAKKMQKEINRVPGMKAVLTRASDKFMRLRERIRVARTKGADMMISLHADSFPDSRAKGSSVYALSVDGATSETAKFLADNENAADLLFGNVSVSSEDKMVNEVLFDLSLTGTIQSSLDIGSEVLKEVRRINRVHKKKVQQAGFAVLKAPNIPSILIETAFISNPNDEKNLRSSAHQLKMAKAIQRGISKYFSRNAPPDTWLSASKAHYEVKNGDSLAVLANRFNISIENLRARNALYTDHLNAGQMLKIPVS